MKATTRTQSTGPRGRITMKKKCSCAVRITEQHNPDYAYIVRRWGMYEFRVEGVAISICVKCGKTRLVKR